MKKILLIIVSFCLCLIYILFALGWFSDVTPTTVKTFVLQYGSLAPVIFICLFTLAPFLPVFNAILAIAGGLIFGTWGGTIVILIGALSGASVGFLLGRTANIILIRYKNNTTIQKLQRGIQRGGFILVFILRLIPFFPFDLISYAAGFSTIRYTHYIIATFFGIIPGTIAFASIGSSEFIASPQLYGTITFLVLLSCIAFFGKKYIQNKFYN